MRFFAGSYIDKLDRLKSSGQLAMRARPAYRLATTKEFSQLRDQIETFVDSLSDGSARRLIRKRDDLENIVQTVNEIRIGIHLLGLGCSLEYEKQIEGLTPDWFAEDLPGFGPTLVEVFTKQPSDDQMLSDEYIEDLRHKLRETKVGAVVPLRLYLATEKIEWSDSIVSQIAEEIGSWILGRPTPGSKIYISGIEVEVWRYSERLRHVEILAESDAFWVNSFPVRRLVEDKHNKYAKICKANDLTLVAACAPSFSTALDSDHFKEIAKELFSSLSNLGSLWALLHDGMVKFDRPTHR